MTGRRHGATLTSSYEQKAAILERRSEGKGYGTIARELGVSRSYVQQVCNGSKPLPPRNPQEYLDQALTQREEYGECAMTIRHDLHQIYPGEKLPSESTIHAHLQAHNRISHALHRTHKYRPWWMEERPTQPGHTFQLDTLKLKHPNGKLLEVFTVYDVVSRAGWADIVPSQSYYVWALSRALQVLGVPRTIQCDNGFGFICPERYHLCHLAQYAFEQGVQQVKYVPIAEAEKQGKVERYNGSIKLGWKRTGMDADDPAHWLNGFLERKNHHPNRMLGGKTRRRTPAEVSTYQHLPVARPRLVTPVGTPVNGKTLSYVRHVLNGGYAYNNAPDMLFLLHENLVGHNVQLDMVIGGGGTITARQRDHEQHRWLPPEVIATFEHAFCDSRKDEAARQPVVQFVGQMDGFTPLPYDEDTYRTFLRRRLKHGMPTLVPRGYTRREDAQGHIQIVNTHTGEVVLSSNCWNVYHSEDLQDLEE